MADDFSRGAECSAAWAAGGNFMAGILGRGVAFFSLFSPFAPFSTKSFTDYPLFCEERFLA
jgi:hypothetical protein